MAGVPVGILDVVMGMVLAFLLASCAPVTTAALNAASGGPAELVFVTDSSTPCGEVEANGVCFIPNDAEVQGVRVILRSRLGELVAFSDACEATDVGATCPLGEPTGPTFIYVAGTTVQASATYRLPDGDRVYTAFATF